MWWLAFKGSEQSWKQTWVVLFTPVLFYLSLECYPQPTVVCFLKLSRLFAFWLDSRPELFQYTVFPCLFCAAFGPERRVFFAISATRPSWNLDCDRRGRPKGPKAPVVGVASTAVTPESKPCDEGLSDLFLAEHAFLRVVGCGTNKGHFACPKVKMSRLGTCNFREKEKSFNTQELAWAGICWMQLRHVKAKIVLKLEPRKTDCTLICQAFRLAWDTATDFGQLELQEETWRQTCEKERFIEVRANWEWWYWFSSCPVSVVCSFWRRVMSSSTPNGTKRWMLSHTFLSPALHIPAAGIPFSSR